MATGWQRRVRFPTRREIAGKVRRFCADVTLRRRKRAYRRETRGGDAPRFAIVVGCQRSGTDMVLWTLDRSLDVDRFDEDSRVAFADCRIRSPKTRGRLLQGSDAQCVIFKPVCDSHRTDELLGQHPGGRAIWVYRDYRDVAHSAVQRWGEMNLRFVRELAAGGGDWGRRQWNRELMSPARLRAVQELVADDLTPHGAAAIYWYLVNDTFFEQQLDRRGEVTIARYEDLVTAPRDEFRRLCRFLEIGYDDGMVHDIFARSARRRSGLPISPKIAEHCEALLARLDQALEEKKRDGAG